MNWFKKDYLLLFFLSIFLYYLSYMLFNYLIENFVGDLSTHIKMAEHYKANLKLAPNFILYSLINFLSTFINVNNSLSIILSLAIVLKFLFTYLYFKDLKFNLKIPNSVIISFFAILFLIANQIVIDFDNTNAIYLGSIVLTVWHNSTTILLMPFVIILFYFSLKFLKINNSYHLFLILFLILLNIYIKPSFLYVYLIAFIFIYIYSNLHDLKYLKSVLLILFISILLMYKQFYEIKTDIALDFFNNQKSTDIVLKPFNVWNFFIDTFSHKSIFSEILLSFAFPIVFLFIYYKKVIKDIDFQFSFLMLVGAMLILILFSETGEREYHGNFFWQAYICNYIFFIVCFKKWMSYLLERKKIISSDYFVISVFFFHLIGGSFYLYRIIHHLNYY